jgi:putative FmdB family regulatory protein
MPTYEYECQQCGAHFEAFQKMSDAPLEKCIQCGGPVHRVISGGSGLIFKGSGFYITDYAKNHSSKSVGGNHKAATPKDKQKPAGDKPAKSTPAKGEKA